MKKLVIIDGNSLINRAFYALPLLSNSKGEFSNGVYGFANILIKGILEIKPDYVVVALDYGKKTFRNEIFTAYKGTRKPTPTELKSQFPILKDMLKAMNITYIEKQGFEADDIIGTLSKKFDNVQSIVITGDRDALQLIDDKTEIWLTKKGITEVKNMNMVTYEEEYGLKPTQVVDLKALMGDSSDNIPGVTGVGEKTALNLMQTWGSLDNIYNNIENIKPKLAEKLIKDKDVAYLSQTLAQIKTDMDLDVELESLKYTFPFNKDVFEMFKHYEFNSLLKRAELFEGNFVEPKRPQQKVNVIKISSIDMLEEQIKEIKEKKQFNFELDNEKLSFAYDKENEYFCNVQPNLLDADVNFDEVLSKLQPIISNEKIEKSVFDIKRLKHQLDEFNITLKGATFDCILAYYLLCAGERDASKQNLLSYYDLDLKSSAVNLFVLKDKLLNDLKENNLLDLYKDIEFPLIDVLYNIEKTGFKIDKNILAELEERYKFETEEMEKTIIRLAGENFNVNSPKQLAEILFDKLKLYCYNNKKRSTSIENLQEMYDLHPIIPAIIRYRKIKKMLATYVEPYKTLVDEKDNLIHTVFHQTLTNTGRLSSSEPNLQNIPVRDEEGRNLRKMFISRYPEGALISADYSQIELRLLAHCSGDESLIEAFNEGVDIHSLTASEVFSTPIQDVDAKMRRTAKAVNFGIIYGISEYGLAQNIDTSRKQAKIYIDKYFERYPKIKGYMEDNVSKAKECGYAITLFNRRRKINELFSPKYVTRQFGERVAMNMPLQGTASDIIKLAMINVDKILREKNMKSKLILQVHDELIIDAPREEIVEVARILKENMENVVKLRVPLTVDVNSGKTWFDC